MQTTTRRHDRLVALFLSGVVAFHPLILRVADGGPGGLLFGIPTLYLFIFVAWTAIIALMALTIESGDPDPAEGDSTQGTPE